jgi:hypothetical protein
VDYDQMNRNIGTGKTLKNGQVLSQNYSLIADGALLFSILSDIDGEFHKISSGTPVSWVLH